MFLVSRLSRTLNIAFNTAILRLSTAMCSMAHRKQLKAVRSLIQQFDTFEAPKIALEQYSTDVESTVNMIATACNAGDIAGRVVCDLGCGCGHLAAAALAFDADSAVCIDTDAAALAVCQRNLCDAGLADAAHLLHTDVALLPHMHRLHGLFDTVVMNPPFGTKKSQGIDRIFVEIGLQLAPVVYSLHKTSTRDYMLSLGPRLGAKAEALAEMRFALPATYKFHKQKQVDIEVDLIRFRRS